MSDLEIPKNGFIFGDLKQIIDIKYYKFLFILMKSIFLKQNNLTINSMQASSKLDNWIKTINQKFNKKIEISKKYSLNNLINILNFVKIQNKLYAAEILENILIIIFSFAFETKIENTFGKYIFNNLQKLKDVKNTDFADWFDPKKFNQEQFKEINSKESIKDLLKNDIIMEYKFKGKLSNFQKDNILYNFLIKLYEEKYSNIKFKSKQKFLNYINRERIDFFEEYRNNKKIDDSTTLLGINSFSISSFFKRNTNSFYTTIYNLNYFDEEFGKNINPELRIGVVRTFFISVYIYYQNKHSPLMDYIYSPKTEEEIKKELAVIPFEYDLTGAILDSQYAGIIMAPCRIEPRIQKLILVQNYLKEKGFFELSKVILFNKNIKLVDFHQSAIKSYQIESLNNGLGIFDNYIIEELNISYNYIKEDSDEFLAKILSHLKGLKTINLSTNDLKNGIAPFLIVLKNLYRQKKIKLENLILNKCLLDDISIYELGELLKSKYCKLKTLYLNMNNIPSNIKFLKTLKKNKSLTEIYLNKSNLGNNNSDNIMRIISNTNIEYLYIYKNKFNDFDDCLRMLFRTKLVASTNEKKEQKTKIIRGESSLYNLDLSSNDYFCKNINHIKLFKKIIEETTLYCIDISHILFGNDPNKILNSLYKNKYQDFVLAFRNEMESNKKEYIQIIEEIYTNEVDNEKLKDTKKEKFYETYEKEISDIIKDKNSKFPVFLKERAKKLIIEKREEFFMDNNVKKEELMELQKNLAKYLQYKKSIEDLIILKEKKKQIKLILI